MGPSYAPKPSPVACVALLLILGLLAAGCGSAAESSCGDSVVTDWSDGRVDGVYPLHCYEEAVARLPEDVRAYSSAADDIARALQQQIRTEVADEETSSVPSADVRPSSEPNRPDVP